MRKLSLVLSSVVLAGAALAAEPKQPSASAGDPMAGWKPPKLEHEARNRQEIHALFQKMEQAGKKGDVDAAAALVDFPVLMVTDDSRGEAMDAPWSREQWIQAMRPFYAKPMDMQVKHKPTVVLLTDSLATVVDHASFLMDGKPVTARSSTLVIRKGGEWKIKSMVEGGWGDMMAGPQTAGAAAPPSDTSTGAGEGAGAGAAEGAGSAGTSGASGR